MRVLLPYVGHLLLDQRLANAREAIKNGRTKVAENIRDTMAQCIEAQEDKHIASRAAETLQQFLKEPEP